MFKIKRILFFLLFMAIVYTRFVNLSWGLPYPMHPDERNMANAIQRLNCEIRNPKSEIRNCLNPHFFAYGQFPLYLGYVGVLFLKFFDGDLGTPIGFEEAVISLRLISAFASILNVIVLLKMVELIISKSQFPNPKKTSINNYQIAIAFLAFIFSPFFIQFSHFGTTESLLMLIFSLIVYVSLKITLKNSVTKKYIILLSFFIGIGIATKISSALFLVVAIVSLISLKRQSILSRLMSICYLLTLSLVFSILFSPHNFISFPEFLGSMKYESDVALGNYRAFYTRQFTEAVPIFFQIEKIFPYVLGWPVFIFFLFGFLLLPYNKELNLLRIAIVSIFLPNAYIYAKWTRFMTPILPLMLVFAVLFLKVILNSFQDIIFKVIPMKMGIYKIKQYIWISPEGDYSPLSRSVLLNLLLAGMTTLMIIPGITYLSIYQSPDVRFTASEWIYKNIPDNSYILFETANVVDIPITNPKSEIRNSKQRQNKNYQLVSFNYYELDENPSLQLELQDHLAKADYIFIPSRRIFANHPRKKYPRLNDYYDRLSSGELGFEKVAEFSSYPKIQLSGKTVLEFPDEEAEETWTVFDHPVIRIYKRI